MIVDADGPWTAAAYLVDDVAFAGIQHGIDRGATLCGLPESDVSVVRNPFYGDGPRDCPTCTRRLHELAEERSINPR